MRNAHPPPSDRGCRLRDLTPRARRASLAIALVVALPSFVAAAQAADDGWYPVGDEAVMLTTTEMVLSTHPPLSGEPTSSGKYGIESQHPGPLPYYLLAPTVGVLGGVDGMLIGTALVSSASLLLIAYVALRTGGPDAALVAWTTALLMVWSIGGTAYLYRPFKAVAAVLPLLLFLHLCAALIAGRSSMLPLWLLAGSYPVAASVQYVVPVAGPAVVTLSVLGVRRWRARRPADADADADGPPGLVRPLLANRGSRRTLLLSAAVVVGAWWAPAYDVVANDGGNARQLYRAARVATESIKGPGFAIDNLARAIVFDPATTAAANARPAFGAVLVAAALCASSLGLVVTFRRRLRREEWAYLAVAVAAAGSLLVSLAQVPGDEGFGFYRVLGAVPVGAFVVTALLVAAAAILRPAMAGRRRWAGVALAGTVVALTAAVAVPGPLDPTLEDVPWAYGATKSLQAQALPSLAGADGRWAFRSVGPRSALVVMSGVAGAAEQAGIATSLRRPPGLGPNRGLEDLPPAGDVLVIASFLESPGSDWSLVGTYEPAGRDRARALASAEQLVDFARSTDPVPLDALIGSLPEVLCPAAALDGADCPAATEVTRADDPLAALPPEVLAIVYLTSFDPDYPFPLLDGPAPPEDLLDDLRRYWSDVPLSVYVREAPIDDVALTS